MTTFNGEKYVAKQLDSILNQTYKNIEIIISDDGSTDNTEEIITKYTEKYTFIKFIKNERNLGYTKNFERAISLCSGDYIALSDQDDIWEENKLEVLLENIGDNLLIATTYLNIDENDIPLPITLPPVYDYQLNNGKYDYVNTLLFRNFIYGCTSLISKELKDKALPFPQKITHDWWLAYIAAKENKLKYLIDKPLVKYRIHANNVTGQYRKQTPLQKVFMIFNDETFKIKRKEICNTKINMMKAVLNNSDNIMIKNTAEQILNLQESILHFNPLSIKHWKLIVFEWQNRKLLFYTDKAFVLSFLQRFI